MLRLPQFIITALLTAILIGCIPAADNNNKASDDVLYIVTTIHPIADVISHLGGHKVCVVTLLPSGASPHAYEFNVDQALKIASADLFIHIGSGLDDWAAMIATAAQSDLTILELSSVMELHPITPDINPAHHCYSDCDHHDHTLNKHSRDPHFWLDPVLVRDVLCPAITEKLISLLPRDQAYFEHKLSEYQEELTKLHEETAEALATTSTQSFIAFHSAWQYFAARYGLQQVAVIAESPGKEPSAGFLADLVQLMIDQSIAAVLVEPQFSPALAEAVAHESKARVVTVDPLGGPDVPGRSTYLELMRFNAKAFFEALK